MSQIRLRKNQLTIASIGRIRFWVGTISGALTAIALSFAFHYSREVFRVITSLQADLLMVTARDSLMANSNYATYHDLLPQVTPNAIPFDILIGME